jgi:hypothetical protein
MIATGAFNTVLVDTTVFTDSSPVFIVARNLINSNVDRLMRHELVSEDTDSDSGDSMPGLYRSSDDSDYSDDTTSED